ncbi:MAG: hypothetical protein JWQ49_4306 [Edaphobacter sp.]|nr:hypothetical protein [Edaphobacter sp.]
MTSRDGTPRLRKGTYHVTRELPAPMQEELPTVEDLEEVVNKLRTEIETLRREPSDEG